VLGALLWAFHNTRSGICFPSYERIAERAGCARSTVAEAIKALEWAGVLTWQNRITGSASGAAIYSAAKAGAGA
jgi:DNA-binding FadR family transcriptional regulator